MSNPLNFNGEIIVGEGVELVKVADNKYEARIKSNKPVVDPLPPTPTQPTPPTPSPAAQLSVMGTIDVQNQTSAIQDPEILRLIAAVQKQVDEHVAPLWNNKTVKFNFLTKGQLPTAGNAQCGFFDNTDTPGAAAWHDLGPNGEPLAKIFVNEAPPSVSFSHEIIEIISDWDANTTVKGVDDQGKQFMTYEEACDPVESNTYRIDGIDLSNFVTPDWFSMNPKSNKMDYLGLVNKQFQVISGGYMQLSYDNGATWTQINKNSNRAHMHESPHSRWQIYKKRPEDRVKSAFEMKPKQ